VAYRSTRERWVVMRLAPFRRIACAWMLTVVSFAANAQATAKPAPAPMKGLCDTDWPNATYAIEVGSEKNAGKPLRTFDANRPMEVYDLDSGRYLFGTKGEVEHVVGQFLEKDDAKAALAQVETRRRDLWKPSSPPFIRYPGAYIATQNPTCKISRANPAVEKSSWVIESNGLLFVGTQRQCVGKDRVKKVSVVACDGMTNLLTDTVSAACNEVAQIDSCIYPITPGVFLFQHSYSYAGGTEIDLRAYDVRNKKKVFSLENSQEGGPETELVTIEDHDKDGVPEIVFRVAGTDEVTRVLKWKSGTYVETKTK
jgi:hypothetical protein